MTKFSKIVLLSKSAIKFAALEQFLHSLTQQERNNYFESNYTIECAEPGETGCPQPISEESAFLCIQRRAASHKEWMSQAADNVLFIAIENYLFKLNEKFSDRTLVVFFSQGGYWRMQSDPRDCPHVTAPDAYSPSLDANSKLCNGIRGSMITLGEMMHSDNEKVPSDDWFQHSPYAIAGLDRKQQIFATLTGMFRRVRKNIGLGKQRQIYHDFPPKSGVEFADVLPILCDFGPELVDMMTDTVLSCNIRTNLCCVGLESRGLLLAAMLSSHHKAWPMLPLRKMGKLPRDAEHPIESIFYKTEYSQDVLEVQPRYATPSIKQSECILIDDVLATGGSICAAANLVGRLGLKVGLVLVLFDIQPLRKTWQTAFENNPHLANVPVRFVF